MTDNEIIKALEGCIENKCDTESLCNCVIPSLTSGDCRVLLMENAFDLINRQKAEIERLQRLGASAARKAVDERKKLLDAKAEIERLTDSNGRLRESVGLMLNYPDGIERIKAEAIKEYRQRLKSKAGDTVLYGHSLISLATSFVTVKVIDETYEEMVGDTE